MSSEIHILGIRHHGPGSARSLLKQLETLKPDIILVEGPADATPQLEWLAHEDIEPPVALVTYRPDKPKRAGYFPLAVFSPEFQAIRYGFQNGAAVRFFDLPQANMMATDIRVAMPDADPMARLAQAAGHKHYERWWNMLVEQRYADEGLFEGVLEMMQALREEERKPPKDETEAASLKLADQREAYMRQSIRQAQAEGFKRVAIVCGAFHGPALIDIDENFSEEADRELLTDMPEVDTEAAWVPWSYSRMSTMRGYGAGVTSPGWYHHLWQVGRGEADGTEPRELSIGWLTKVATLLRKEGFDASSANVIETVRLAEAVAAMRELPFPGLQELGEATQTVMCFGEAAPLKLIQEKLIVSERMGAVPPDAPMVPLQRDLYHLQRELKLRPEPTKSTLTLDLRNDMHLKRSHLLHRLNLLNIPWGAALPTRGKGGTYREVWSLQWQPEYAIRVIEANLWGNTVPDAAVAFTLDAATRAEDLASLTQLLDRVILADLPEAVMKLMERIQEAAALSGDVPHMMEALPPLVRVLRYGSARKTDEAIIQQVVDGLIKRICIGLPSTCAAMNDEAASDMFERLSAVHQTLNTLRDDEHLSAWHETLQTLTDDLKVHNLLSGRSCRLLFDARVFKTDDAMPRLERALFLSPVAGKSTEELLQGAFWLEGFLKGSGLLIVHDETLWQLIDNWINEVRDENFTEILPLLRRTFSSFSEAVRVQISERVRALGDAPAKPFAPAEFDEARADAVLPLIAQLLGVES